MPSLSYLFPRFWLSPIWEAHRASAGEASQSILVHRY